MKENLFNLAADRKDKDSPEYIAFLYKAPLPTLNGIQQLIHHVLLQYLTELLKNDLKKMTAGDVDVTINEIKQPDMDAKLVAENIAAQLERRIAFRRAMKQCLGRTMRAGAKGIKIACSGRLGGAEIARSEWMKEGRIPLHTLRSDIDYGFAIANTSFGAIGVKVWVFNGEIYDRVKKDDAGLLVKNVAESSSDAE